MTRFLGRFGTRRTVLLSALWALAGCSNGTNDTAGSGGQSTSRGGNGAGGATMTNGGSASGGTVTGGNASGGSVSGGSVSGGSASTTGGSTSSGGEAFNTGGSNTTGGSTSNGGRSNAGSGSGGTTSSGGNNSALGGATAGGSPTGGSSMGGKAANGGGSSGGSAAGGSSSGGSGTGGTSVAPGITKDADALITYSGLTVVSYGGYLNGESFQQDAIVTHKGYQYTAFWNTNRHVVMARRALPSGAWEKFEFTDYTNSADDAHNTISLGVCPGDGTLHLSFDHHGNDLHYRKSTNGFLDNPATATWGSSSFGAVTKALVGSTAVAQVTYPRFVTEPGGGKMLFGARIGSSGSGDEYLWEYDATSHAWTSIGKYIDGIVDNINAYPHGLSYTRNGSRLHVSWCWRETPDANTNHDLLYAYSDDHGRTWKNNAGANIGSSGTTFMNLRSTGLSVWAIKQNRGLINQEHMAVDSLGRVHVLLSHMPDAQADDSNFDSSRTKSQFFDYFRDTTGTWKRVPLGLPVIANFRGKLAISSSNNVYAILPDLRIAAASAAQNFASFSLLDNSESGRFFSDPLIDTSRLLLEDKLTIYYPQKSSPNISGLDYTLR